MHAKLQEEFQIWRHSHHFGHEVLNIADFTRIVNAAKKATYDKYKGLSLDKPIAKNLLNKQL